MKSYLDRLMDVSVKSDVTLRNLALPTLHCVLASAALRFGPGQRWTEREVNALLIDWLAHEGAMLTIDHVELRRTLVDAGLLARDGFGRSYWRPPVPASFSAIVEELAAVNLLATIADARTARQMQRAERARLHGVGAQAN